MGMRKGFGHVFRKRSLDRSTKTVRERTRNYYVRYTDWRTGKRRDLFDGRTKKDAKTLLGDLERRAWEEKHLGRNRIREQSLRDFLQVLLPQLRAVLAGNTYAVSKAHLEEIAEHFGDTSMSRVTRADVGAWIAKVRAEPRGRWKRKEKKIAPLTLDRIAGNARRAWNLAAEAGVAAAAESNPWRGLALPKIHQRSVPYISPGSLLRLYAAVDDPAAVLVGETGLRRGELYRLEWDAIQPTTLTVRRSKSGKPRTIPLSERAKAAIAALGNGKRKQSFREALPSPGWLYRRLREAGRRAGLGGGVGVHTLRHAFATGLADAGVPITRAAALLGHASVTVTQRYYSHLPEYAGEHAIRLLEALKLKAEAREADGVGGVGHGKNDTDGP